MAPPSENAQGAAAQPIANLPFSSSRLRALNNRLETVIDPRVAINNAMALAATDTIKHTTNDLATTPSELSALDQTGIGNMPPELMAMLQEVSQLRSEIVGVQSVLNVLKKNDTVPTLLGKKALKLHKAGLKEAQQQLQHGMGHSMDSLLQEPLKAGKRVWKPPDKIVPVGRAEATILDNTLEDVLPAGSISSKFSQLLGAITNTCSPKLPGLLGDIQKDVEVLDLVLKEAARQVASHCIQRGGVVDKVRQRFGEIFESVSALAQKVYDGNVALSKDLQDTKQELIEREAQKEALERDVQERDQKLKHAAEEYDVALTQHQEQHDAAADTIGKQQTHIERLEALVEHLEDQLYEAARDKDVAILRSTMELQEMVESLSDERDDLLQRLRFTERQLSKLREENKHLPMMEYKEVQTDPIQLSPPEMSGASLELPEEEETAPVQEDDFPPVVVPKKPKKKKRKGPNLGGFGGLMSNGTNRFGQLRSQSWLLKCLLQIYLDKITADAADDRHGLKRTSICDFVYDWHLNKYGLKKLAEDVLVDVLVSVRYHSRGCPRLQLFGEFCRLFDENKYSRVLQDTEAISFYLMALQALATPNSIAAIFPTDESRSLLKVTPVCDALKTMFRHMNDLDSLPHFVKKYVDGLVDPVSGVVDLDQLMMYLMEEYVRRVHRNIAQLKALFRAADTDADGLLSFDDFVLVMKHAQPNLPEHTIAKMFRAALDTTADPQASCLDIQSFVSVARESGLSYWSIDHKAFSIVAPPKPVHEVSSETSGRVQFVDVGPRDQLAAQQLATLHSALQALEPPLDLQMQQVVDKIDSREVVDRIQEQHRYLTHQLQTAADPAAAWLAFRLLLGQINTAMYKYQKGISSGTPSTNNSRINTTATSRRGTLTAPTLQLPITFLPSSRLASLPMNITSPYTTARPSAKPSTFQKNNPFPTSQPPTLNLGGPSAQPSASTPIIAPNTMGMNAIKSRGATLNTGPSSTQLVPPFMGGGWPPGPGSSRRSSSGTSNQGPGNPSLGLDVPDVFPSLAGLGPLSPQKIGAGMQPVLSHRQSVSSSGDEPSGWAQPDDWPTASGRVSFAETAGDHEDVNSAPSSTGVLARYRAAAAQNSLSVSGGLTPILPAVSPAEVAAAVGAVAGSTINASTSSPTGATLTSRPSLNAGKTSRLSVMQTADGGMVLQSTESLSLLQYVEKQQQGLPPAGAG